MARRSSRFALVFALALSAACAKPAPPMRASDLADNPEAYVDRAVTVDVVESIDLAPEDMHGMRIELPEHRPDRLALVFPATSGKAAIGAGPTRVRGRLRYRWPAERPLAEPNRCCYVIDVSGVDALPAETPVPAPAVASILADRARWDRRLVVYEGEWSTGFEASVLDDHIWLTLRGQARFAASRLPRSPDRGDRFAERRVRIRVEGRLFAHGTSRYGHLDGYPLALEASRLEALSPPPPPEN